jgi:hypothetical protein
MDWGTTAAWAQALLSALAIFAAVKLQDRSRHRDRQARSLRTLTALDAIATSCAETLQNLETKVRETIRAGKPPTRNRFTSLCGEVKQAADAIAALKRKAEAAH